MKKPLIIDKKPRIGVGLIIKQKNKIIVGRRLNEPMPDSWQLPGGWIKFAESPEQAVQRQLQTFQGLSVGKSRFVTFSNNVFDKDTHTVSLYFMLNCLQQVSAELINNEKNTNWHWADWNELPQPLFLPLQLLKESGFSPI